VARCHPPTASRRHGRFEEQHNDACFIVKDATGQALGVFLFRGGASGRRSVAKLLTRDDARRMAAKLRQGTGTGARNRPEPKTMAKPPLQLVTPVTKKRAVAPLRRPNSELRSREHLTETEVAKLIEAARGNRYGHRDATMILVAYRHGLRASEVCDLRWEQIDWNSATLHVRRVKSGKPSTHPIRGDELRALRKLQREAPKSPFLFVSERGGPFTTDSFNWMVKRAGQKSAFRSKCIRTCCATLPAISWQAMVTIRDQSRTTLVTRTSNTPYATLSCRRCVLKISGATKLRPWPTGDFGRPPR